MTPLATIDVVGAWLGIFLTICILSFLYKDNPFYKLAEHLFVGVSIGYVVTQQLYNVLVPKLGDITHQWWRIFPLILVALMFVKAVSRRWAWMGRYPLAFVVAFFAGLQINAVVTSETGRPDQLRVEDPRRREDRHQHGQPQGAGQGPGRDPGHRQEAGRGPGRDAVQERRRRDEPRHPEQARARRPRRASVATWSASTPGPRSAPTTRTGSASYRTSCSCSASCRRCSTSTSRSPTRASSARCRGSASGS